VSEIIVSEKEEKDQAEISTSNTTEENIIGLEFDDELIAYATRKLFWNKEESLDSIEDKKARTIAEMGMWANMRIFQFF